MICLIIFGQVDIFISFYRFFFIGSIEIESNKSGWKKLLGEYCYFYFTDFVYCCICIWVLLFLILCTYACCCYTDFVVVYVIMYCCFTLFTNFVVVWKSVSTQNWTSSKVSKRMNIVPTGIKFQLIPKLTNCWNKLIEFVTKLCLTEYKCKCKDE